MNEGLRSLVGQGDCCPESPKECYADTLMNNLKRKQLRAKSELDSVTAALEALEKNPEVANILELISKAGR
jgi:hypothetical protein